MRGKKAIINTVLAMLQEVVAIICAFILPRLILASYGSAYNGITSAITQFLSCAVLLRAGIGGATRAALYKPLAEKDTQKINSIMSATNRYMKKIAFILAGLIIVVAFLYPFTVTNEFDWFFTASLFIIIGISTFAETFFGISNLIILQADQKLYISSLARILSTITNTVIAVILIKVGCSIHVVKFGSALAFCCYPLVLNLYVKKAYKLDKYAVPDNSAVSQRWDVFFHQVANFVMNNTDIIILSIFLPMTEVSVYSVYNLIASGLKKTVLNFTNALEAAFGNMFAINQKEILKINFKRIEYLIYSVATVVYAAAGVLILEFVSIYTKGITDAEYVRPLFAMLLLVSQFFLCIRQPYQLVVQAAGHYKQTKKGAIIEPIINIVISIIAVIKFGIIGVICGTLIAIIFRTIQYVYYVSKNLIDGTVKSVLKNCLISVVETICIFGTYYSLPIEKATSYGEWIEHGMIVCIIAVGYILIFSVLFCRKEFISFCKKLFSILGRSK